MSKLTCTVFATLFLSGCAADAAEPSVPAASASGTSSSTAVEGASSMRQMQTAVQGSRQTGGAAAAGASQGTSGSAAASGSAGTSSGADAAGSAAVSGMAGASSPAAGAAMSGMPGVAAIATAAGSGGTGATASPAAGSGSVAVPPMVGQDCGRDPLASEQPYGSGFFQQFRGLMGCTAAADLTVYREMLPAKFEMPADPQVCFYILDFLISGVGPYHEGALLLPIEYAGESGKYVLTMVLDNSAATSGGRAVGFPKYMSDVTLTQSGNDWTASGGSNGTLDLLAEYKGECVAEDTFLWPDFINLTPIPTGETSSKAFLPPRDGRALMVPAEHLTGPKYFSLRGQIKLSIGDHLPWNGLVDETKPFTGYLTTFKGGIDLGNRPLD